MGLDRRYDPARIAEVLREIDADIACLQEVDNRRHIERHADQWAYLGEAAGYRVVLGGGFRRGRFDNAILTRFPVLTARRLDLTVADYPPRGALDADLRIGDRVLRVIATHFGLRAAERRLQANRLMMALGEASTATRRRADAVLLMGDLNEWRGRSGAIRAFDRRLGPSPAPGPSHHGCRSWRSTGFTQMGRRCCATCPSTAPLSPVWRPIICPLSGTCHGLRATTAGASGRNLLAAGCDSNRRSHRRCYLYRRNRAWRQSRRAFHFGV